MKPFQLQRENPSKDELLERIRDYISRADSLMPKLQAHDPEALNEARQLRRELDAEQHEYDKVSIRKLIKPGTLIAEYTRWIEDADVHTAGVLNYQRAHSFAYDVRDYAYYDLHNFKWE